MNTKDKLNEHTANLALSNAPTISAIKVGRNFAKPIPRKIAEKKNSFWAQFKKLWYN